MLRVVVLVFILLSALVGSSHDVCTKYGSMSKIQNCQQKLQTPSNLAPIPGGGSKSFLQKLCKNRLYVSASSCIAKCQHIKVTRLYAAWAELCGRRHVYFRYTTCYKSLRPFMLSKCLVAEQNEIRSQVQAKKPKTEYALAKIICKASLNSISCQDNLISGKCGIVAAAIIRDFNTKVFSLQCNYDGRPKRTVELLI